MHRAAIIIICSAALSSCAPGAGGGSGPTVTTPTAPKDVPAAVQAKWAVVWADEFTDATLDAANWIVADGTANVNNELEYYTPSDVYLENGALVLRSQRRSMGGRAYTSGEVRTGAKRTVGIGSAVEWRTQSPSGKGIWPANWLVNTLCDGLNGCGANWPPEIDVMELRGSLPDVNLMTHWWGEIGRASCRERV